MGLTCADCSSLGLDKWSGYAPETVPEKGVCDSCGGPWPKRPGRTLDDAVGEMRREIFASLGLEDPMGTGPGDGPPKPGKLH
jgi:hypothetical protein